MFLNLLLRVTVTDGVLLRNAMGASTFRVAELNATRWSLVANMFVNFLDCSVCRFWYFFLLLAVLNPLKIPAPHPFFKNKCNVSITVSPNITTTYSVTVTQNNCSSEDEVVVTVLPRQTINAGNDVTITLGESTTLNVEALGDILWDTGETTSSIQGLAPGDYYCDITDENACTFRTDVYTVARSVGVAELDGLNNFQFFPNPTNDVLNIDLTFDSKTEFDVNIIGLDGKLLHQTTFNRSFLRTSIDVSNMENGMYFIQIANNTGVKTEKFIKLSN